MSTEPRRRKRSTHLALTTMVAGAAGLTLQSCDDPPPPTGPEWNAPAATGEQVRALRYQTAEECKVANEVPDPECDAAWSAAQSDHARSAPVYSDRPACEDIYGAGNCVPRNTGGGNFFVPLLTGFVIGELLDVNGRRYYRGTSLYRQREDSYGYGGGYVTGWGGYLGRDYRTGSTTIARGGVEPPPAVRDAPPKVRTRTAVVSRGGFGGGGRGYGG